jgi:hypothetical protein
VRVASKALTLAAAAVLWTVSVESADSWVEIKSPHFTVVSNAGERSARNIAWQFEQFRLAIEKEWPWARLQLSRPITVIAAKDESSMRTLAPAFWENRSQIHPVSVFATGVDHYYIALRADIPTDDSPNMNPYQPAYWTYTTLSLETAFAHGLPLWFREGLSQVLSNTIVTPTELQFGRPMPSFLSELQHGRYGLAQLMSIRQDSPEYTRELERERYDAQA